MTERSELSVQIAKVSGQKIETKDQKIHNFQLTKIGKKWKARIATIAFTSIRGQQNFEGNTEINPEELKIENDKIQSMFEKYKKKSVKFNLEGLLFSSTISNETKKKYM